MSLNGLDDVKVQEAYNSAIAELGGWFLLKYTSRDEVDILEQGTGGIVEIRNAIETYEEQSPLFGFLRYRRRSVLVKYVPDGCSRLVIARLTVHFNAITEKFPHDTVFSIEAAKELKDSKLSAACSSHTASASISSSTSSLRRRRLMEINEDEEDEDEHRAKRQSTLQEERAANANADQATTTNTEAQSEAHSDTARLDLHQSSSYQSNVTESDNKLEISRTNTERSKSPSKDLEMRRTSSSSTHPDMYNFSSSGLGYKPKVKLGPRPSLDSNARSRGTGSSSQFRPISTLPAGLKLFGRGSKKGRERPQSQYPVAPPNMTTSSFHPSNNDETSSSLINNSRPRTSGGRPNTSSGASARTLASPTASVFSTASRTPTITPEKARLMKALELRKKQLAKPPTQQLPPTPIEDHHPTVSTSEESEPNSDTHSGATHNPNDLSLNTSDSPTSKIAASELTRTDSSPPSPAGTERAASTKASSISESTDETVHATRTDKESIDEQTSAESRVAETDPLQSSPEIKKDLVSENNSIIEIEANPKDSEPAEDPALSEAKDISIVVEEHHITPRSYSIEESAPLPDIQEEVAEVEDIQQVATSTALPPSPLATSPAVETDAPSSVELPVMSKTEMQDETVPFEAEVRELKLPRSKFSLQNLKESSEISEADTPEGVPEAIEIPEETVRKEPERVVSPVTSENLEELNAAQGQKKRQSILAALKADGATPDLSVANSEIDFDDDLMDELQAATVQEAQPVHVSKSPVNSVFPPTPKQRYGDPKRASISSTRNFSSPLDNSSAPLLTPDAQRPNTARSVSAASKYLDKINSQQSAPLAKKVNIGGGIAQRIKALEKLQGAAPPAGTPTSTPPPATSAAFFSVRKAGGRDGARSPSVEGASPPLSRNNSTSDFGRLRGRRSSSIISTREPFPAGTSDSQLYAGSEDALDTTAQQSPLLSDSAPTKETVVQRRSSLAIVKELISPRKSSFADSTDSLPRPNTSSPALRPASSRRSSRELSRTTILSNLSGNSMSHSSTEDYSKPPSTSNNSKTSMTTRMLRRMSSSLSNSHKSAATSPTVKEDAEPAKDASPSPESSMSNIAADLGDVNVQFPDTLLWKRRNLLLDTSGNMILNAAQGTKENFKAVTKKYHMSEFTRPHEPDFDAQELPNSVALDFLAGGGLQFACEDRTGQMKALSVLQETHKTWFSRGQQGDSPIHIF